MLDQYYVIGHPVAHSLSPAIYTKLFQLYSMGNARYDVFDVTPELLPNFIAYVKERGVRGFNITMPLKETVLPYLAYHDPDAYFGVNTVVADNNGALSGYSTDADGFRKSLSLHEKSYENSHVVFIGCGGAGRALIKDALSHGVKTLTIINRTADKAREFLGYPGVKVGNFDELTAACEECNLLINATPLGMHGTDLQFTSLDFLDALPKDAFVADLIYSPSETMLLAEARAKGHDIMNGLGMLVWQGMFAFQKYTGQLPSLEEAKEVQQHLENIIQAREG